MTPKLPPWSEPLLGPDGRLTNVWRPYFEQLTASVAASEALAPGFGSALPDVTGQPEGRLFVDTTGPALYQLQSGVWEAL